MARIEVYIIAGLLAAAFCAKYLSASMRACRSCSLTVVPSTEVSFGADAASSMTLDRSGTITPSHRHFNELAFVDAYNSGVLRANGSISGTISWQEAPWK